MIPSSLNPKPKRRNGYVSVDASGVSIWTLSCLKRSAQPFSRCTPLATRENVLFKWMLHVQHSWPERKNTLFFAL